MDTLELLKIISPEMIEIIEKRYQILRSVSYNQPIGRRTLANELNFKERAVRDEVDMLKSLGLLSVDIMGMYITEDGKKILSDIDSIYYRLKGIPKLEEQLKDVLGIKKAIIAPGNLNDNRMVLKEMGKITSRMLKSIIQPKDIIGITGGSTMAAVAKEVTFDNKPRDIMVIPARGGLGSEVETQSNSIAAKLAEKLGGSYRLLYVPDSIDEETLQLMLKNKDIKETMEKMDNMNILVFGIGRADVMAKRRNMQDEKIGELIHCGAVAESLGHYFDINGEEVLEYKTIGLPLEKFKLLDNIIGVAGGEDKAEAILAVSSLNKNMTLITDESSARKILEIV
ncbi:sugar-binding domain-containing protein [Tissierella sp.]|uniref:sugar-binding transcriptional regulator n=1 Tax=Tissierella sp. TaxID=41274 RepID=UPI00285994DD|nr:sugar-binding domain-containing protein [Tissierella sp.]MDR7855727.1 sugar-binding domain-containing protein [Tissierella sp.]